MPPHHTKPKMDNIVLITLTSVIALLFLRLRFTGLPYDEWDEIGYYSTRDVERLSRTELRLLPYLTGVPNAVPLYRHRRARDLWAYRIRDGPWINPDLDDIHRYAIDENGDPLMG